MVSNSSPLIALLLVIRPDSAGYSLQIDNLLNRDCIAIL